MNYVDNHLHLVSCKNVLQDLEEFKNQNYTAYTNCQSKEEFIQTCKLQEEINLKFPNVTIHKTYGIHPWFVSKVELKSELQFIENLLQQKQISAIGECGFDFYTDELKQTSDLQKIAFQNQLELAIKFKVPIIIHNRKAWDLNFSYWQQLKEVPKVVFHSFAFTKDQAISLLNKNVNAFFSFGNICGHKKIEECIKGLPKERILLETDAPFNNHSSLKEIIKVYNSYKIIY